jgi:hypothetical protein
MCQILLLIEGRNTGKIGGIHPGDVVSVVDDSHEWSPAELTGRFRVVKIPGLGVGAMGDYLDAQTNMGGVVISRRARGFAMDGALGALLRASKNVLVLQRGAAWEMFNASVSRTVSEKL